MFKWYEGFAMMIVFLRGVRSALQLGALSSRNLRWLCTAWPRLRLRNRPNAATPWDSAEGEEDEDPSAATWQRSWLGEGRQYLYRCHHSTVHAKKTGFLLRECSVKCRKVV